MYENKLKPYNFLKPYNLNEKLVGVMKDIIIKFDALELFKEYF